MGHSIRFTPKNEEREFSFELGIETKGARDRIYLKSISYSTDTVQRLLIELVRENGVLKFKNNADFDLFEESVSLINERLLGLSDFLLEKQESGIETTFEESDDSDIEGRVDISKPGYTPDDIFVENKPFSLKQIVDLIHDEDLELTPNFQRNFIWDRTQQSKLIESIFLGLPLPSIFLSQYEDGRLTIVDGLQRITTICNFLDDKLTLNNLEYLHEYNGLKFSKLKEIIAPLRIRRFGQTQIICFVIDYRSPSKLKFDLFRRLNTGGKPLNNQEMRNCLTRSSVQKILSRIASSEIFKQATTESINDTRFEAQENILKFYYFKCMLTSKGNFDLYNGKMEGSLNDFIDEINKIPEEKLISIEEQYYQALGLAFALFGRNAFRKVTLDYRSYNRMPINKLLFLCTTLIFSENNELTKKIKEIVFANSLSEFTQNKLLNNKFNVNNSIVDHFANFLDTTYPFYTSITYGTNSRKSLNNCYLFLTKFLKEFFDVK